MLYVQGQYWVTIVKSGRLSNDKGGRQPVSGDLDLLRQQTIGCGGFIKRPRKQGIKKQAAEIRWGRAFDGKGVVLVKGGGALVAD